MPLLALTPAPPAPGPLIEPAADSRAIQFESLDGTRVIPYDDDRCVVVPRRGLTGFEMSPQSANTGTTPGLDGAWLYGMTVAAREVNVPMFIGGRGSHTEYLQVMDELRALVSFRNSRNLTVDGGAFNIAARSVTGERLLTAVYTAGLEGDESAGVSGSWWAIRGLTCLAVDPHWRDRVETVQEYQTLSGGVYIGDGSGAYPFPRRLSPSAVVGSNMAIEVESSVPVAPTIQAVGPATGFTYTADTGGSVNYTAAIPAGRTLTITTGRVKSARLDDGTNVWGNIAMASRLQEPLHPGENLVTVLMPGASGASRLRVRYYKRWESAW